MFRRLTTTQLVVDIIVAVAFLGLSVVMIYGVRVSYGGISDSGLWQAIVLIGMSGALALRRLAPGLALGVAWITAVTQMLAGVVPNPANLATFAVVYAAAAYGTSLVRWLALASALVAPVTITFYVLFTQGFGDLSFCLQFQYAYCASYVPELAGRAVGWFVAFAFSFLLAWTIGQLVRTRIRARASREATIAAELEIAAEQERTRIARDMHDVVAHSLAVVVAQADGARYVAETDPDATREALRAIATTAREALADVRVLLAQLRFPQEDGPQPTLVDLDRLYGQVRQSGLSLVEETTGTPLALGAAQQLAVYRIVQESLTNALRHADTAKDVLVRFDWTRYGLEIGIQSALPELKPRTGVIHLASAAHEGHGIAGMTERAALTGGWLRTRTESGRFIVTAWLPVAQATTLEPPPFPTANPEPAR
ncbi:sensor histidine kinase [Protaetiibacter larvae]|uniref:histidine kinase n=1 Tax=Protaetiibacter larvae TaxID=2592654 RepID=A0A5C1Y981_9MICO|nr:histidine kinase [Protaetiibacter larvae]QEO09815.1 sensor histidine kinase [Protaetiibacter larvae]